MTVTSQVVVSIPLPDSLKIADINNFFVQHDHTNANGTTTTYYYKAYVEAAHDEIPRIASFTIPAGNGFSTFTFKSDTRKVTIDFTDADASQNHDLTTVGSTFPTATKAGYNFVGWTFNGVNGTYTAMTDDLLTKLSALPAAASGNITATPVYTPVPVTAGNTASATYAITATAGTNGAIAPSGKTDVTSGKDQTYAITPDKGYAVADVLVDGKSVGAVTTYTFKNVTAAHTIAVTFKTADWKNPFTDVAEKTWYFSAVQYASTHALFNGTTDTTFSPDAKMTRGMLITVLWRMENKPSASGTVTFSDVKNGSYYADAIRWAASAKIVNGTSAEKFDPDTPVTREQVAAILYQFAQYKKYDTTQGGMAIREFSDYSAISAYALPAMQWAVNAGLIQGNNRMVSPKGSASRAQVAAILMRFCQNIVK